VILHTAAENSNPFRVECSSDSLVRISLNGLALEIECDLLSTIKPHNWVFRDSVISHVGSLECALVFSVSNSEQLYSETVVDEVVDFQELI
jgi:hypothetical protein